MSIRAAAIAAILVVSPSAQASDPNAQAAVDAAMSAIQKGRGARCALDGTPVQSGGYWDCLDVGPYRFVSEYGRVRVFVTGKDMDPFPILESREGSAGYLMTGPWIRDLPQRMMAWWTDEIEGGRSRRDDGIARGKLKSDAERRIQALIDAENPKPAAPEPQAPTAVPGGIPAPEPRRALPLGGVEIAPGVVRLPDGPQRR